MPEFIGLLLVRGAADILGQSLGHEPKWTDSVCVLDAGSIDN
jgi:hypothetical protein